MSLFRKVLRLFKYFAFIKSIIERISNANQINLSLILKCFSDAINSIYYLADHVLLLHKINAISFSKLTLDYCENLSNLIWLIDIFFSLGHIALDYKDVKKQLSENSNNLNDKNKDMDDNLKNKLFNFKLDVIKNVVDIPVFLFLIFIY